MTRSERVLVIVPYFFPAHFYGGPIVSMFETYRRFSERDPHVTVLTVNSNGPNARCSNKFRVDYSNNLRVYYFPSFFKHDFSLLLLLALPFFIFRTKITHLQSAFSYFHPFAVLIARAMRKKIIISPRGCFGEWCLNAGSSLKRLWIKSVFRPHLKVISWHATSHQEKVEIADVGLGDKVFIIPNGVSLTELEGFIPPGKSDFLAKFQIGSDDARIISCLGRIDRKKGIDILLRAVRQLEDLTTQKLLVLIAGPDYGEKESLLELSRSLAPKSDIRFIGELGFQDKMTMLHYSDVFALPSMNENFGNVYLESLAVGTPIVASKFTPWQIVEQKKCGAWVEPTPERFAIALFEILQKGRNSYKNNALELAQTFDWGPISGILAKIYAQQIHNGGDECQGFANIA